MEKQDVMLGVAALIIIILIAGVVKPMMTGKPMESGLTVSPTATTSPVSSPVMPSTLPTMPITPVLTTSVPTPTPLPKITWDKSVQDVGFVNPATTDASTGQNPTSVIINNTPAKTDLVTFAKISGKYGGTTQIMYVPFPYWEFWYTVEPSGPTGGEGQKMSTATVTGSKRSGDKSSGGTFTVMSGSYSVIMPRFSVLVMDGNDPNHIVRTITPPGGIDKNLWAANTVVSGDYSGLTTISDPRPWKEKFFEGERSYYFVITAEALDSYSIEFKTPSTYVDNPASVK